MSDVLRPKIKIYFIAAVLVTLVLVAFFIFLPLFKVSTVTDKDFMVRVRILHNVPETEILPAGKFRIRESNAVGDVIAAQPEDSVTVSRIDDGILLGKRKFTTARISITSEDPGLIDIDGTTYPGSILIIRKESGLDIINIVSMENYLRGVVPREVHVFWPMETLKAQAVAARSYALYKVLARSGKEYDLSNDTRTQMYGGFSAWNWRTSAAVRSTKNEILVFDEELVPAYYHACCGGHTQSAERIWGSESTALESVKCPWCKWSPHFRWQTRIENEEIARIMKDRGYPSGHIEKITPGKRDDSGRISDVSARIGGAWIEIPVSDFRSMLGGHRLKSANFHIKKYPRFFLFSGYGWGHGVGMCQWGSFMLGLRRWSYEKILKHYYHGAGIKDMEDFTLSAGSTS